MYVGSSHPSSVTTSVRLTKSNQKSSMHINIQLKHEKGNTEAKVLIDSGAEGLLIDKQFCKKNGIKLKEINTPIPIFNVGGSANEGGSITKKACLLMRMTNADGDYHDEQCELLATSLGGEDIILGTDWLHEHNPQINWVKNCLIFSSCVTTCIISRPKITITAERLTRPGHKKAIHYTKIEDKPEDQEEENDFFAEFYEEWYNEDPFEVDSSGAIKLRSTHNKSQELAEAANKKKDIRTTEEIVPKYVLKHFAKIFSQEASQRLPEHSPWDHSIEMKPGWEPKGCKLYPLTEYEEDKLYKMIQERLKRGTIWVSKSPQASPFFFVNKKEGDL